MSEETTENRNRTESKQGWIARGVERRWVRLTCLISAAVFAVGIALFILHFGWLESVNIWTQIGVVFVGLLPLLVAAALLIRRRFSMKSAMVALTMFTLFLAFTIRPVYEARQLRMPVKRLLESGARLDSLASFRDLDGDELVWEYVEAEKADRSQWWIRLLGKDALLQVPDEVLRIVLEDRVQFQQFLESVEDFKKLKVVWLGAAVSDELLREHRETLNRTFASQFALGNYRHERSIEDLDWLEGNESFQMGWFVRCKNAPNCFRNLQETNLKMLSFVETGKPVSSQEWSEIFRSPTFQKIRFLEIRGYRLTRKEAKDLSCMPELVRLNIDSSVVADFEFLREIPQLRSLHISFDRIIKSTAVPEFPVGRGLRKLTIRAINPVSDEAIDRIRKSLPAGCKFGLSPY